VGAGYKEQAEEWYKKEARRKGKV